MLGKLDESSKSRGGGCLGEEIGRCLVVGQDWNDWDLDFGRVALENRA